MIDIKFLRENPEIVKQNIRNKFQDAKLPLVDEVIGLDKENREIKQEVEALRARRNKLSKEIGALMGKGQKEEAEKVKAQVAADADRVNELSEREKDVEERIRKIMMMIPNIIDPSVPIGRDDSENVEVQRYGEPAEPDFEIPYHTEIMENPFLCTRFYDRPGLYLLRAAVYDPQRCSDGRDELCRNGCHDVQNRRGRFIPDRNQRALDDRQIHRYGKP